jgi:hypothetical protein
MLVAETVRREELDLRVQQLQTGVPEHLLGEGIDPHDPDPTIDDDDLVGRRLEKRLELRIQLVHRTPQRSARCLRSVRNGNYITHSSGSNRSNAFRARLPFQDRNAT